ncbi:GNAT family N-acetyltransferase [Herbiconiux sp. KACC 21604]|uniref:GNAT family N-acetyltransferase n=1 Tax=unclassified Herbiconiux TaxID=2618217 RepID=UPI001492340D|nr:GNAT family N-acetyltransferase [Herbiconiux sp. SALV-R1]QJU52895.1 GNAT family N-acetyltransferase [Herbiconiux sp. SALV-R1]WPO87815.1 GNAT family N-acetyltransferase [Herbiconiux sp. KACC 21604]
MNQSAPDLVLRPLTPADVPALVLLNRASVPAVNDIDEREMAELVAWSTTAVGAVVPTHPDAVLGFVLALPPGLDYASENYRWFSERGADFSYVDRIVVAEGQRGSRVGERLYQAVFEGARAAGATEVDCEVNVEPPNPGSLRFHGRLGFAEVGRQATKGGSVVVALLARPLEASDATAPAPLP